MYAADAAQCFQDLQFRCVRTSLDGVFDNVSDAAAGCMPTQLMASPDSNRPAALSTYHSPTETLQAQELICADMAVLTPGPLPYERLMTSPVSHKQLRQEGTHCGARDHPQPQYTLTHPNNQSAGNDNHIQPTPSGNKCALLAASQYLPLSMVRNSWKLSDYLLIRHLQHSSLSDVVEAVCGRSGARVVLKVYSLPELCSQQRSRLMQEIRIHTRQDHPNILPLWAAFVECGYVDLPLFRGTFHHAILVTEMCPGGDLLKVMDTHGGLLPEAFAVRGVMKPLLEALAHLHAHGIVHRDIKPGNILFDRHGDLKLADFGLAVNLVREAANIRTGTLTFMAPEVLRCSPHASSMPGAHLYSTPADIWSCGVLLYAMLTGKAPFQAATNGEFVAKVTSASPMQHVDMGHNGLEVSPETLAIIHACLRPDPSKRPTAAQLLCHPLLAANTTAHTTVQTAVQNIAHSSVI